MIIGYDTEFQSIEPVDREELRQGAKNKLLSYQFATQLIEGNVCGDIGTPRSSGIIIPKTGKRIFLEEFIAIAMADFLENNPDSLLPRDIYLVGHFNRMDLPGFEEFKNTAQKMAANVRGTFASITGRQKLEIRNGRKNLIEAFNIRLRDTLLLAPESK